jgi:hypothetical protein
VEIPVNTGTIICVPSVNQDLTMNRKKLNEVKQEKTKGLAYHFNIVEVGSGVYEFESLIGNTTNIPGVITQ